MHSTNHDTRDTLDGYLRKGDSGDVDSVGSLQKSVVGAADVEVDGERDRELVPIRMTDSSGEGSIATLAVRKGDAQTLIFGPSSLILQEEPLLDRAMRGDPKACLILGGLLLVGVFVVAYRLLK